MPVLKIMIPAMLSAGLVLPIADTPPTLAVENGCRAAARLDPLKLTTVEGCMSQERSAREEVKKDWAT